MKTIYQTVCGAAFLSAVAFAGAQEGGEKPAEPELVPLPIEDLKRTDPVDFATEIFPIFKKNCISCHSESKAKAKLVLEFPDAIRKGSENGEVVKAGDSANSVLYLNSAHREEPVMPPAKNKANAKNLTPRELALVKLWIDQGAKGEGPVKTEKPLVWRPLPGGVRPVYAVSISPDGRYLAAGRGNGIEVFEVSGGERVAEIRDGKIEQGAHRDLVGSIRYGDGWLASGGFREVKLWKEVRGALRPEWTSGGEVVRLAISADGALRAVALKNGEVNWWAKGKVGEKKTVKVEGGVTALAVDGGGKIAVGSADKKLRVYVGSGGAPVFEVDVPAEAVDLVFCQDGRLAGALTGDAVVRVWKTDDEAAAPQELKGLGKPVRLLAGGGEILAGAADGGETKYWKVPSGSVGPALNMGGEVTSLAVHPKGTYVAATVGGGSVKMFSPDGKAVAVPAVTAAVEHEGKEAERKLNVSRGLAKTRKTQLDAALKKKDEEAKKVDPAKEALAKAEAEKKAKEEGEKEPLEALEKAKAGLAASEAKAAGELKPLQEAVAKAEEAAKSAPEKARVVAEEALAKAREALSSAEEKAKNDLMALQDQVAKAEEAVKGAAGDAKAGAGAGLAKAKATLASAEAKVENELKPFQAEVKKAEGAVKTAAGQAKAKADGEIAKAKSALRAAENKGKNDRKSLADQLKKAEDAANKVKGEADAARRAERGARLSLESAQRIAAREVEALKVAEEKMKSAEAAVKAAEAADAEAKEALAVPAGKVAMVAFAGGRLASVGEDGKVRLWRPGGTGGTDEMAGVAGAKSAVAGGNGDLLLAKGDGSVSLLGTVMRWELARVLETGGDRVTSVDFSPDGKLVAVGTGEPSRSGTLSVWDRDTGEKVWENGDAHSDVVSALAFSPDGRFLLTCAADRMAKVFEAQGGKFLRAFEGHTGYVSGVAWRADGLQFATAGADHDIKVWEFETGDQKKTQKGHSKEVTAVGYLGTGDTVVTGSGDGSVRISNAPLPSSSGFVQCVAVDNGGKWIVSGGPDGVLRVWSAGDRKLVHVLK